MQKRNRIHNYIPYTSSDKINVGLFLLNKHIIIIIIISDSLIIMHWNKKHYIMIITTSK